MRIVDTKGQTCPAPLIAAKRALVETAEDDSFIILTDNIVSFENLSRFLSDNKAVFISSKDNGVWTMTVTRKGNGPAVWPAEDYCETPITHFEKGKFVIVLSSDKMGEGDHDLGRLLIGNFLKAVKDLDRLPEAILIYNSGVKLATNDSEYACHLEDLEKMGVELHICATCVNYYGLADKVEIGKLSNMFVIAQAMASASNIIKP